MAEPCKYCGNIHGVRCPSVKAIEYYQDGSVKRIEYVDYAYPPSAVAPYYNPLPHPSVVSIPSCWPAQTTWAAAAGIG